MTNSNNKSFTILEVILAIFILTVAAFASFSLIQQTVVGVSLNQSKLIAYYLAQEGVEIVRNIRDTNWLHQGEEWTTGLAVGDGEQEADYQSTTLESYLGRYLKIDTNGFYNYISGIETKFKRKILVTESIDGDGYLYLEVKVIVEWSERGMEHNTKVINHLYKWQ
ncbi:MAG: hypothetical protein NT012_04050 [Candidatus Nealsonbacteria bacterium]|jgi:hypothetical protein|nr:hypothetical protein [Candidatus Nealsonbacteria bacterium]